MRIGAAYFPVTLSYASYFIIHRLGHVSVRGRRERRRESLGSSISKNACSRRRVVRRTRPHLDLPYLGRKYKSCCVNTVQKSKRYRTLSVRLDLLLPSRRCGEDMTHTTHTT